MIDYDQIHSDPDSLLEITMGLTLDDLRAELHEMLDAFEEMIKDCVDEDVVFQPQDPQAYDPDAARSEDVHLAWTLAHVIVHLTASAEEKAFLSAEMARGVLLHGRSRYEVPWQEVTTIAECRQRLAESRRICLACLDVWPDEPHYENKKIPWKGYPRVDARGFFILGLNHAADHLEQVRDIVRQAKAARSTV